MQKFTGQKQLRAVSAIQLLPLNSFFFFCPTAPEWASSFTRCLDHTLRTTVGRTPLEKLSAQRRDLYLKTHNTNRKTSLLPVGFEATISAGERPQTYTLDRAATGTGSCIWKVKNKHLSGKIQRDDVT